MIKFSRSYIASSSLLFLFACGGSTASSDGSGEAALTATLSSIQTNIFDASCATSSCHSSTSQSGGLSLASGESFSNLVGVGANGADIMRVTASDSTQSYLINKLEGTQTHVGGSGAQMPQGRTALTTDQINTIKDWIDAGALDN